MSEPPLTPNQLDQAFVREQRVVELLNLYYPSHVCFEVEFEPVTLTSYLCGVCVIDKLTIWGPNLPHIGFLRIPMDLRLQLHLESGICLLGPAKIYVPKD